MSAADGRASRRRATWVAAAAVGLVVASGCGEGDPAVPAVALDVPETVALGRFPEPLSDGPAETLVPPTVPAPVTTTSTTTVPVEPIDGPIGDVVDGNRVLVIGDTVFQATSPRAGGEMCDALTAFGWQAEIAAEVGRFIEFGREVVTARVVPAEPEWDAAVVMLGNHFDGDVASFREEYAALLDSLAPRPTVVYTLVDDDTFQSELNDVIRELAADRANVVVVDWAELVAAEADRLTDDTPSGLSDEGLGRVAVFAVATLGEAPDGDEPGCLEPFFTDDSAIVL